MGHPISKKDVACPENGRKLHVCSFLSYLAPHMFQKLSYAIEVDSCLVAAVDMV